MIDSGVMDLMIALLLPALMGYAWLYYILPGAHLATRVGYGYLLGTFITSVFIILYAKSGMLFDFYQIVLSLLLFTLVPVLLARRRGILIKNPTLNIRCGSWRDWIWLFLFSLLLIRYGGLLVEVFLRPIYPWDAWMNWAPKGKVWFGLNHWVEFYSPLDWLEKSKNLNVYTMGNSESADYPPLVPLVQLWTAIGLGEWRDNWINIPWVLCALAFCLAMYGQLKELSLSPLLSMLTVYFLFCLPYLNVHVALAGYADLWMSAYFCLAFMSLVKFEVTRSKNQLLIVLLMVAACVITKRPGIIWAFILMVGVLFSLVSIKYRYWFLGVVFVFSAFVMINGGLHISYDGEVLLGLDQKWIELYGVGKYYLEYHDVAWFFVVDYLFRDSWHLFWWAATVLLSWAIIRFLPFPKVLPSLIVVLLGLFFLFFVFFFTRNHWAAEDSTTINRAALHLVPTLLFFLNSAKLQSRI